MRFLAVAALLVLSVGGCWFATQYVASALAYAPALGPPWATLGEERLYAPWQWIVREEAKPAAREDAESRYQQFKDYVAQEFTGGRRFLDDLPHESIADDAELVAMATNSGAPGAGKA